MSSKEVIIIGAGVIGCSIAYHLAQDGISSQVIERDSIASRASGKAWAVFVYPPIFRLYERQPPDTLYTMPLGSVQPWLELCWLGYHRLNDINKIIYEETGVDIEFGEITWTKVALSEEEEETQQTNLDFFRNEGYYEPYWLKREELISIYPNINPSVRGALASPCLQVEPYKFTLGLAQAAEVKGTEIIQGEVIGFHHTGSRISSAMLSSGTQVEADIFILSMGPWSKQGTSWLGQEIPIRINREQCLKAQVSKHFPPYALRGPKVGIIPKVNGDIIMGISGIEDLQTECSVTQTTDDVKIEILEAATELLPELGDAKLIEHRGDLESWSPPPQGVEPLIGRLPGWDNIYLSTGFGSEGIMMSLGAGQIMSDIIMNEGRTSRCFKTMEEHLDPARLFT